MRVAILTISTSVAAGRSEDTSGLALADAARRIGVGSGSPAETGTGNRAEIVAQDVLPDDPDQIERWLRRQVADSADLILTTGGTGFTPDDLTPEATLRVIERHAPGIAEAMRAESLRHTPMGMLSRAVAGIAGSSLIINFPGSPKAIAELFPVVAPVLEHAVATLHRQSGRRHPGH